MLLLLVRHAESTWNVERRWAGQSDPPLSRDGRRSCERLVAVLASAKLSAVASSDLTRARQTAGLLADGLGLDQALVEPRLGERAAPLWSGRTAVEIERRYPGRLEGWRSGLCCELPGAEPWAGFSARVEAGVMAVVQRFASGSRILVVTHAGCLRTIEVGLGIGVRKTTNLDGYWVRVQDGRLQLVQNFHHRLPELP